MGIPKLLKTSEQVEKDYLTSLTKDCTGLTHYIDTGGSCQCGYYIKGEASGSFPFIPNRSTRRKLSSFKRGRYELTKEDRERLQQEAQREQSRREIRERARVSRREAAESEPPVTVSLLVGAEAREAEDG